jgi:Clostridial hydrophobic W.
MPDTNRFGVNIPGGLGSDAGLDSTTAAMQQGNIGWIRFGVDWNVVQDGADSTWNGDTVPYLQEMARLVRSARAHCLNVLLNITYKTKSTDNGGHDTTAYVPVPASYRRWEQFVAQVARMANAEGAQYFSIGNENNVEAFTYPHAGWNVAYDTLYRLAARKIRSINGQNKVVALEWAWNSADTAEVRALVAGFDSVGLVDVVAVHKYGSLTDIVDAAMMGANGMRTVVSTGSSLPVWLTETGPGGAYFDSAGGPGDDYRDEIAASVGRFIHLNLLGLDLGTVSQYPNWQKVFVFRGYVPDAELHPTGSNPKFDRGLGTLSGSAYVPRHAYWAYRYLAEQWSEFGAVQYQGFIDTAGRSPGSNYGWSGGHDGSQYAGTTGLSLALTGMQVSLLPASLGQAGMGLCYRAAFNWVVDWQSWRCGADSTGPFPAFGVGQPRALEAFQISTSNPLRGWDGQPMVACGRPHLANYGWVTTPVCTPTTAGASADIGRRGYGDQIQAFYIWIDGDIR